MPFNGAGLYSPPGADYPVAANTLIQSALFNDLISDMATALSLCITKDGQQVVTNNIPMAGFVFTGIGSGLSSRTRSASIGDVQDGTLHWAGNFGGTANALTATPVPAITAYAAPQFIWGKATATNTAAATMQVSGIAVPKAIQKNGLALVGGEIVSGRWYLFLYDGAAYQLMASSDFASQTAPKQTVQTLAAGAAVAVDMSLGCAMTLTLGAAANAIQAPTNLKAGMWGWIDIVQDATGARTCTWAAGYKFVGGVAPVSAATGLSTAANAVDRAYWVCTDGTTVQLTWGKGFA